MSGWNLYLVLAPVALFLTVWYVAKPRRSVFMTLCAFLIVIVGIVGTAVYRVVAG